MIADPAQRPPLRFALLAVLLVLPALGLAALALRALALDRRAADAEAAARAQDVAAAIAVRLTNVIHAARWELLVQPTRNPGEPRDLSVTSRWSQTLLLDAQNRLVWPREGTWPPVPSPLTGLLPPELGQLWDTAAKALASADWQAAAEAFRQFVEEPLVWQRTDADGGRPVDRDYARYLATGLLQRAQALALAGDDDLAVEVHADAFRWAVRGGWPGSGALTEAGVPVVELAAHAILDYAGDDASRLPAIWRSEPRIWPLRLANLPSTPLLEAAIAKLRPLLPALAAQATPPVTLAELEEPFRTRKLRQRAYAAMAEERDGEGSGAPWPDAMLFHLDREAWLALWQPVVAADQAGEEIAAQLNRAPKPGRQFSLHRWADLVEEARAAARTVDPRGVFGIAVTAAGADFKVSQEEPAGVVERAAAVEARLPQELTFTVAAAPVEAEAFFAAQRRRERTLGALVLGAVAVSLAAAVATWGMLARQHRLGVEKSNLVAAVSHELRAPLASVRLLADNLAQGRVPDDARRGEALRLIGRECRRLGALVDNVLDLARIARGRRRYEFGPTDVASLMRETVASLAPAAAERGVGLRAEFTPGAEQLEATVNGRALQQALLNLLDNALKHAPAGSEVGVRLARGGDGAAPKSEIGNLNSKMTNGSGDGGVAATGGFTITVTDAGPGIPAADRERVFEPFHRVGGELRRETTGVGIGLAIVRHIVAAHGGRVWIEDAEPRGTRVVVEIP